MKRWDDHCKTRQKWRKGFFSKIVSIRYGQFHKKASEVTLPEVLKAKERAVCYHESSKPFEVTYLVEIERRNKNNENGFFKSVIY